MDLKMSDIISEGVLEALIREKATITELADKHQWNYYTVRLVIKDLQAQGRVVPTGFKGRAILYGIPRHAQTNSSIPMIHDAITNTYNKSTVLLQMVGNEDKFRSVEAIKSLPRNVTRLFMAAVRVADTGDATKCNSTIGSIYDEMMNDYTQLQNTVGIYKQILNNNRWWTADSLKPFANDEQFDRSAVLAAYTHYYGDTTNTEHLLPVGKDKSDANND